MHLKEFGYRLFQLTAGLMLAEACWFRTETSRDALSFFYLLLGLVSAVYFVLSAATAIEADVEKGNRDVTNVTIFRLERWAWGADRLVFIFVLTYWACRVKLYFGG